MASTATPGFVSTASTCNLGQFQKVTPQTCSTFTANRLLLLTPNTASRSISPTPSPFTPLPSPNPCERYNVTMKKGRVPRPMMPQRPQQQRTALPEDGTPVFALYVRTSRTKIWYPMGAVKGDDRSKNLVDALKGGFARGMYQRALDRGMAQTLYGKEGQKYVQGAIRLYPQLKKYTSDLQFGYKVSAVGLDEQTTKIVTKDMAGSLLSNVQKGISAWFKNVTGGDKK